MAGIFSRGISRVCQTSLPASRAHFSSKVIWETKSPCFMFIPSLRVCTDHPLCFFSYFIIAIFSGDASSLAQTVEILAQAVIFVLISCVYTISSAVCRVGAMRESGRKRELQRKNGMLSVDFDVRDAGVFPLTRQENCAIIAPIGGDFPHDDGLRRFSPRPPASRADRGGC